MNAKETRRLAEAIREVGKLPGAHTETVRAIIQALVKTEVLNPSGIFEFVATGVIDFSGRDYAKALHGRAYDDYTDDARAVLVAGLELRGELPGTAEALCLSGNRSREEAAAIAAIATLLASADGN